MTTDTRLANDPRMEKTRPAGRRLSPPVDIYENNDGFLILADLPGVEAQGLTVEYNPPELAVTARRGENGDTVVFERRFELGSGIDASTINAELKDGVLRIELKKSPSLRPRRIEVRAA
jgi:HSP20 family protein